MSGIYIPDMELPARCEKCPLYKPHLPCCKAGARTDVTVEEKSKYCPLVAVPDHGRLIDGDILQGQMKKRKNFVGRATSLQVSSTIASYRVTLTSALNVL